MGDPEASADDDSKARRAGLDDVFKTPPFEDAHESTLEPWKQGDLVTGLRLFWATVPGDPLVEHDEVDGEDAGASNGDSADGGWALDQVNEVEGFVEEDVPRLGIITSQTCDIMGSGPGAKHPVVQVSPLILLSSLNADRAAAVRKGMVVELFHLPAFDGGLWAVDLRISLPVSKGVLLVQQPRPGFNNEAQALEFAERVAAKSRRPAVHDAISDYLVDSLNKLVKRQRASGAGWVDRVEQFRVRVTAGDRLAPQELEVMVVTLDGALTAAERQPLRNWYPEARAEIERRCDGARLTPLRFLTLAKTPVDHYRESVPLAIKELGRRLFW
jgi:hypothetical protein